MPRTNTVSISVEVTAEMRDLLDDLTVRRGFTSKSEFVRTLLREEATRQGIALSEAVTPRGKYARGMIKKGMRVRVNPFEYAQHLSKGAVIKPAGTKHHNGYKSVIVADVFKDDLGDDQIDVFVGSFGDVDHVPASACEILES